MLFEFVKFLLFDTVIDKNVKLLNLNHKVKRLDVNFYVIT